MNYLNELHVGDNGHAGVPGTEHPMLIELIEAAKRFEQREYANPADTFVAGKAAICRDMADKLAKFESFASAKQQAFAEKLVLWSKPRAAALVPAGEAGEWGRNVPKLFAVMQEHAHLHVAPLKLSRRNQDSLVWIMYNNACVGKIEAARAQVWVRKAEAAGTTSLKVLALIEEFEADPLAAAKRYGKLAKRCCSCGLDLTHPDSIAAGIGPICARKFG